MKETFFDGDLRRDLAAQYGLAGIIMRLSMVQNGKLPQFMGEEIL